MGRIIPYIMENNKCLKPPTRNRTTMSKRIKNDCDFPTYSYMFSQPCPSCLCQARCGWKPSRHHSTSSPTAIFSFSVKDRMHNNLWFHLFWFCKMLHMWIWRRKAWKKCVFGCVRVAWSWSILDQTSLAKSGAAFFQNAALAMSKRSAGILDSSKSSSAVSPKEAPSLPRGSLQVSSPAGCWLVS